MRVGDLPALEGVEYLDDPDELLVTVVLPAAEVAEAAEGEEEEEGVEGEEEGAERAEEGDETSDRGLTRIGVVSGRFGSQEAGGRRAVEFRGS